MIQQIKLQQTIQTNSAQQAEKITSIDKKLAEWYSTSQTIASDIKQVTTEVNTLVQDLSKLYGTFQKEVTALHNESAQLGKSIDETGKKHLEFQQKFQNELKALTESIDLIKQSQTELEKHFDTVKVADTTTNSDSPAVIEPPTEADNRQEINFQ